MPMYVNLTLESKKVEEFLISLPVELSGGTSINDNYDNTTFCRDDRRPNLHMIMR